MTHKTIKNIEHIQCIVGHWIDGNLASYSPSAIKLFDEHDNKTKDKELLEAFAGDNNYNIGCFIQYKEGGVLRRPFLEFNSIEFESSIRKVFSESLGGDYVSLNIPFSNGRCAYEDQEDYTGFNELICEESEENAQ
ncbi:MAG: hypothetical protein ACFFG0_46235 [Candidatus Thorarchaeota archaeon]